MEITYDEKTPEFAELFINGNLIKYPIPLKSGTHGEVFRGLYSDGKVRAGLGKEIVAYIHGALIYKEDEWANQDNIRFPSKNYLRFPYVMTIVPKTREFGVLEGGMLVDLDLEGQGIEKQVEVPGDLNGWKVSNEGLLAKDKRIFLPYDRWYQEQWDENNGAVIVFCGGLEGAGMLEKISKDSKRNSRPIWKVNPEKIKTPEKRVPVLNGCDDSWLDLYCNYHGDDRYGCAVGVEETGEASSL